MLTHIEVSSALKRVVLAIALSQSVHTPVGGEERISAPPYVAANLDFGMHVDTATMLLVKRRLTDLVMTWLLLSHLSMT